MYDTLNSAFVLQMTRDHTSRMRWQNNGFVKVLCSRKYFRLLLLFVLAVFVIFITFHLEEGKSFPREFHRNNFVDLGQAQSLKNIVSANVRGNNKLNQTTLQVDNHQNTNLERTKHCLSWCNKENTGSRYFLSAVLLVRIYSNDLAKLSTRELMQWLYYLKYAGFEHVYVYDAYVFNKESQKNALDFLIKEGFVTYVDWSHKAYPYSVAGTQESAYQHCLNNWGNQSKWQASIDIDEYPFCPQDTKPNFLQRFVANFSRRRPDVSQITMQNFLFLGKPLNDKEHPLLIDRLKRRTPRPANALVKPIYKMMQVTEAHVHHHDIRNGISEDADRNEIRLNHYWGARLQNWGEDTPEILDKTTEDNTIQEIVEALINCDRVCLPNESIIYTFRWN